MTHLIPDQYDVRSEASGFKVVESTSIPVYADQAARSMYNFRSGELKRRLTVSAEDIPLMKTDRSDVATTFSEKEIKALPLFKPKLHQPRTAHSRHVAVRLPARFGRKPAGWHSDHGKRSTFQRHVVPIGWH